MAKKKLNNNLRQYITSGVDALSVPQANIAAAAAYTAHDSGATAVTSDAATDLDTTAAAVAALTIKVNALITALKAANILASS